jgi:hypothetical protein
MSWDVLFELYRVMTIVISGAMVWMILTSSNWRTQTYAALVLVPFLLRAVGVK